MARRSAIGLAWRAGLGLALLGGALLVVDLRRVVASADLSLLAAALVLQPFLVLGWLLAGWRHAVLIGKPHPPVFLATRAYVLSVGLNVLLPLRAGEIVKATYLREHFGTRLRAGFGAIVIERLLDAIVVGAIGIAGLAAHMSGEALRPMALALALGIGATVVLAAPPPARLRLLARRAPRLLAQMLRLFEVTARVARSHLMLRGAVLSVLAWGCNFAGAALFLMSQTVVGPLSLAEAAAVYAVTLFASAVPGLPGGIGAYQAAGAFVLVGFGHPLEPSIALLIVMQAAAIGLSIVVAVVELLLRSSGVGSAVRAALGRARS
jgi:uncharacterized membrane protein YbhN (UPF0104 family)